MIVGPTRGSAEQVVPQNFNSDNKPRLSKMQPGSARQSLLVQDKRGFVPFINLEDLEKDERHEYNELKVVEEDDEVVTAGAHN